MMVFCKHCGKQITNDSLFCQYCGSKQDVELFSASSSNEELVYIIIRAKEKIFDIIYNMVSYKYCFVVKWR